MMSTVEDSPWHREANVWIHTLMSIYHYNQHYAPYRSERQQALTFLALLAHDFGKPEAEEEVNRKDGTGTYRRYAGHELVSANQFVSMISDSPDLRELIFTSPVGLTDETDLRRIRVMIEHHLPYGLKDATKRANLRRTLIETLGAVDEICFYDMLRSDAAGRVSDDHAEKIAKVEAWIEEFRQVEPAPLPSTGDEKTLYLMFGVSGAGKSTFINEMLKAYPGACTASEDDWRVEYATPHLCMRPDWSRLSESEKYQAAWEFCHLSKPDSGYDAFAQRRYRVLLDEAHVVMVDRMNTGRKGRRFWITEARNRGYRVKSVEFWVSEPTVQERQLTRGDKRLPAERVHQMYFAQETPWLGVEVDSFMMVI